MSQSLKEELERFKKVVADRRSVGQVLDLFKQLQQSTKFSAMAKPMCFGWLIQQCAERIPDSHLMQVQQLISDTSAASEVRRVYLREDAEEILRPLIVRLIRATKHDGQTCCHVFRWFESSGMAPDLGHSLGMAIDGGITEQEIDPICDLIHPFYWAGTIFAPQPKPEACAA